MDVIGEGLVARRLIGRGEELALLNRAAASAARGEGRCVLIEGQPGIGKTRLVSELHAGFAGRSFEGRCYQEDASFPFAPLQTGLRALLRSTDESEAELFARRSHGLADLLPELAGVTRTAPSDPAATQRALLEAISEVFFDLAGRNPLLVVFEDLHWSDESTLDFIRFLARRLEGRPVLLVATYRPEAIPAALAHLLETLRRERLAEHIVLAPLAQTEVDGMLRALFESAQPVSPDFLVAVNAASEGNPLYA